MKPSRNKQSETSKRARKKKRVRFPLVRSKHPGALHLTGGRIAEILNEEDAASSGGYTE